MKRYLPLATLLALIGGVLFASSALAYVPQFYNGKGGALLRSVSTLPSKGQPDAIEFNNNGPVISQIKFIPSGEELTTVTCTEFEYGTTVVTNTVEGTQFPEGFANKLAMPFGVAEGDECKGSTGAPVPTYFDTNPMGVVPAFITFTGGPEPAPIFATIHNLKISYNVGGKFCTAEFENTRGQVINWKELKPGELPGEETMPNTLIAFEGAPFKGKCEGPPTKKFIGTFSATLFVETMSTLTDTVYIN